MLIGPAFRRRRSRRAWRGASNVKLFVTGLRGLPDVMGGVESHCEELLPRLQAACPDIEITVLARRNYVQGKTASYRGICIRALPAPRLPAIEAIVSTCLGVFYAWLKGADVLHIHAIGPGLMTPVARLLGLRVVVTYHSRNYEHGKWSGFAKFMLRQGERASVKFAHRIIVIAPWLMKELARAYPHHSHKLVYIPNGVPDLASAPEHDQELDLEPGYVLAVSRLVPEKGLDYLVKAFQRSGSERTLVIVGDADHASAYSRELLAAACERIIFTGRLPRTALGSIYRNAALFILASYEEGLPISALEAAACGTPMLLSDIPANRDLCLPAIHYFTPGDTEALSKLLTANPSQFAVDAAMITSRFNWDRAAARTAQVLAGVLRD
jgi:glycosyltransferase involved in cell wall biosynthesis